VGKPCEGEPHARFDEGRMKFSSAYSTQMTCERALIHAQFTLGMHHKICNLRYGTLGYGMNAYEGNGKM
ncbi:hypothetical protein, partial [Roseburia inulinivorans]|uniref:hypothetical protein n=1 Tax=Roseburia inulinivorans TaxID=360807 RepID=UPI001C03329D